MHYSFSASFKTRQILFYLSEQIISAFLSPSHTHTSRDVLLIPKNNSNKRAQNSHKLYTNPSNPIQYLWCIESCIDDDEGEWWHDRKETSCFKLTWCFVGQNQTLEECTALLLHLLKCRVKRRDEWRWLFYGTNDKNVQLCQKMARYTNANTPANIRNCMKALVNSPIFFSFLVITLASLHDKEL